MFDVLVLPTIDTKDSTLILSTIMSRRLEVIADKTIKASIVVLPIEHSDGHLTIERVVLAATEDC